MCAPRCYRCPRSSVKGLLGGAAAPEIEDNSSRIAEIVLIGIVKLIGEVGIEVIDFRWSNCDHMTNRNIYAAAERHSKSVVRWRSREATSQRAGQANILECICIDIGVGAPEQSVNKRLDPGGMQFNLRAEQICKHVALDVCRGASWEVRSRSNHKTTRGASVSLQIRLDS